MRLRVLAGAGLAGIPSALLALFVGRAADRLVAAPRHGPGEELGQQGLDALGGEVVRLRARDGLQLAARWLPPEATAGDWSVDPHEAIVLLHGWTGSVAPDLRELGPSLRQTAGVLGLDMRGHGASEGEVTTFGLLEVEDVGGALAWLGERGVTRVAFVGRSMGAAVALASVAVLGDGTMASADADPDAPRGPEPTPRPVIVAVVGDSASADLVTPVAAAARGRFPGPVARLVTRLAFQLAGRRLHGDLRATEPIRIIGLVAPVPVLLIHGEADDVSPVSEARRLAEAGAGHVTLWTVAAAGHGEAHRADPTAYESRVATFLRRAFGGARRPGPIIDPGVPEGVAGAG